MKIDKKVTVKCPHCQLIIFDNQAIEHKYMLCECKFCLTKFRWSRSRTDIIVPADHQYLLLIKKYV